MNVPDMTGARATRRTRTDWEQKYEINEIYEILDVESEEREVLTSRWLPPVCRGWPAVGCSLRNVDGRFFLHLKATATSWDLRLRFNCCNTEIYFNCVSCRLLFPSCCQLNRWQRIIGWFLDFGRILAGFCRIFSRTIGRFQDF